MTLDMKTLPVLALADTTVIIKTVRQAPAVAFADMTLAELKALLVASRSAR